MADKRYMLAVDIGSTNIKARIYDGKFKVQASNSKQVFDIFLLFRYFHPIQATEMEIQCLFFTFCYHYTRPTLVQ